MSDTTDAIYDVLAAYTGLSDRRNRAIAACVADAVSAHIEAREAAAAEAMRDIAAETAREACLVPPDGGSPNADEVEVCDEAERRIRALPLPATADALARALEQVRAEEREACAEIARAAGAPAVVALIRRNTPAAIRARGKEVGGE